MNQASFLFVCAVLAAASSLVKTFRELSFSDSYIDWTGFEDMGAYDRIETRQALLKLNIQKCETRSKIYYKILAGRSYTTNNYHYEVYDRLIAWSDEIRICYSRDIELVLKICWLMHDDESLASFAQFLVPTGRAMFGQCRPDAISRLLRASTDNLKSENELDRFFAALLDVGEAEQTDPDMIEAAKTLSFVERNDLNVAAAVEVAKESRRPESGDSFEIFDDFLSRACSGLKSEREEAMNIVALANAFGDPSEFDPEKVHKWQEYTRVCLSWMRADMREAAVINIKQQLEATSTESPHTETLALPEPQ